ncbi:copia protein [Cucumis melo var. makuwa]|uniref:Copia protein n=1 Tax=Cucumis melo var. makuwa TaxID=1194695 RepID=A0A5D3CTJ6_CUCMM|nr:copia protein [Cucumis melo var. makuwa]TYK15171.1 copia protein [Cucumis melo var. makuwa]
MKALLGSQDVWDIVNNGYEKPESDATLNQDQREALQNTKKKDQKALTIIHQAIDDSNFEKISRATTAHQAWQILENMYKGVDRVKKIFLQKLSDYESLHMKESKLVSDYTSRLLVVVNEMKRFGETISDEQVVEKILRSLDEKFNFIVVAIEESKDSSTMSTDQLMGSLQAHKEKLLKKNKHMSEQLFQSKLKLKDKENSLEKGNRGHGGNHEHGDFRDRGRGSYSQRKFDENNSNSNSSRGRGRQHYSKSSEERSNNDRRNRVKENVNYAEKDEESGDSSLFLTCKGAETCENSAWYLDSGASNHMCGSKSMFVELDEYVGGDIVFGDTTKIPVKGKARKNMVKGLPYVKHPDQLCEGCLHGKQSRKSFPQESSSRVRRPLDRKTLVYFVKEKSEVFGMFKRFKALVEKESGYYIKALRSDRGGDFTSNEFKKICAENGIRQPMTVPFTPQQNGVVERKNQTILNMARSMLKNKKLPKEFRTQVLSVQSYVHIPDEKRSMLDDKSEKYVFVGSDASLKDYKLYNPVTKKTIVNRDVVFDEEASWNWNDNLEDYKFLLFPDDHDEPSDIASPSTPLPSLITPQQSTSSSASSSEGPRGMRSLRDIYDEN